MIEPSAWDIRFLELAQHVSAWSKDPSTKVGAAIVDNNHRIVSLGFNGFPRGVSDDRRLNNREDKYEIIVHAEMNAILFAGRDLLGCTIYVWPMPPCSRCASIIVQAGMYKVVAPRPTERWRESCVRGKDILTEAGVESLWLTQ